MNSATTTTICLLDQSGAGGLGQIECHDDRKTFDEFAHIPNVAVFAQQANAFREMLGQIFDFMVWDTAQNRLALSL